MSRKTHSLDLVHNGWFRWHGIIALIALAVIAVGSSAALGQSKIVVQPPILATTPSMNGKIDATWENAAHISLAYDFISKRTVTHPTTVLIAQDKAGLDIAFRVLQSAHVTQNQETNGPGVTSDDSVAVFFSPSGLKGFNYVFMANARGARYQTSSENTAYAPRWIASASPISHGYVVTMHIPFSIIRSSGSKTWRAQFVRNSVVSNVAAVWTHSPNQLTYGDPTYEGILESIGTDSIGNQQRKLPPIRIQPYVLATVAQPSSATSTSSIGVDVAIPITPTASLLASLHPDYSNVETDQQTIAPSAFPRQYNEKRPFFTQLSNSFNAALGCINCPQTLYTPSIPSFSEGYALEGTGGSYYFGSYDALSKNRSDTAQNLNYVRSAPRNTSVFEFQRVTVDAPGVHDDTTLLDGGIQNRKTHMSLYANVAVEQGSQISIGSQNSYDEEGLLYSTASTSIGLARQHIGDQFSPVDGYVAQNDITGYESYANTAMIASKHSKLQGIQFFSNYRRFVNHLGRLAQFYESAAVNIAMRNQISFSLFQNTTDVLTFDGQYLPFSSGDGAAISYRANSTQPSSIVYSSGFYYHGRAINWIYSAVLPIRRRVDLNLSVNENLYASTYANEPSYKQWLESVSFDWQFSHVASFDIGARRIVGPFLPNAFQTPNFSQINTSNISSAFHYRLGRNEFYVVYGDPNAFQTNPSVFLKWIRYIGADKGS